MINMTIFERPAIVMVKSLRPIFSPGFEFKDFSEERRNSFQLCGNDGFLQLPLVRTRSAARFTNFRMIWEIIGFKIIAKILGIL